MIGRFPDGIDPALIHLTGTIVTWWGRIEGCLVYDLITLRNLKSNEAYAAKEPFPVQTGVIIKQWSRLQRAFVASDPKRLGKVTKLADDLREVSEDRNVLVHYFWPYGAPDSSNLQLQCVKPKRGQNSVLEFRTAPIDVDKLNKVNERLIALYRTVMVGTANLIIETSDPSLRPIGHEIAASAIGTLGSFQEL